VLLANYVPDGRLVYTGRVRAGLPSGHRRRHRAQYGSLADRSVDVSEKVPRDNRFDLIPPASSARSFLSNAPADGCECDTLISQEPGSKMRKR
jgi:hypothetical protein